MAPRGSSAAALQRKLRNEELLECAMAGRHKDVARLLDERANIEVQDREGYTPISEATSAGHTVVVGQLLRSFADPDRAAFDGRTALHRAALHNWIPTMRLLLEKGADPDIKDKDGATPFDVARTGVAKELIANFDREENRSAREELRAKRAQLPPAEEEAEEAEGEQGDEQASPDGAGKAATTAFEHPARTPPPPPALSPEERRQKAKEARAKAKAERERRYQEALDEIAAITRAQAEEGIVAPMPEAPPPLTARVEVRGAGERRLNGAYHAEFASKDRVEFKKEDDDPCQIVWTQYWGEWRMMIGDYKMGNTLYRHRYKPNIKVDEALGCPMEGWVEWFGKPSAPTVRVITEDEEVEPDPLAEEGGPEAAVADAAAAGSARGAGKPSQFIELHSKFEIVKKDPTAADADAGLRHAAPGAGTREISLTGGERVVETADGLFSVSEVPGGGDPEQPAVVEIDSDALARAWMEDLGGAPEVPRTMDAIQAAKSAAQSLFAEGRISDARQATTAAIHAAAQLLQRLINPGEDDEIPLGGGHLPSADEVEAVLGVLHSNRSLLLLRQIEAGDPEALAHGAESAWSLVAAEASKALAIDKTNFKASFRRARAYFEIGDLESALTDATLVVDHYSRNSPTPNPEAAALRERIQEAIQKERRKWGQKAPVRWNRSTREQPLVMEVSGGAVASSAAAAEPALFARHPASAAKASAARRVPAAVSSGKAVSAPRTGGELEKALLSTLKGSAEERLAYVKEHVSAEEIRRFFRRAPLGPDLLAAIVRVLADFAAEDAPRAAELLGALAAAPSAKTQAGMFDADETACMQRLLAQVGPEAAAPWRADERDPDAE